MNRIDLLEDDVSLFLVFLTLILSNFSQSTRNYSAGIYSISARVSLEPSVSGLLNNEFVNDLVLL